MLYFINLVILRFESFVIYNFFCGHLRIEHSNCLKVHLKLEKPKANWFRDWIISWFVTKAECGIVMRLNLWFLCIIQMSFEISNQRRKQWFLKGDKFSDFLFSWSCCIIFTSIVYCDTCSHWHGASQTHSHCLTHIRHHSNTAILIPDRTICQNCWNLCLS